MELKNQMVRGVVWTVIDRGGSMAVQVVVSLLLGRLLMPEDFGLISALLVFSMISDVFVQGGFMQALIRKPEPTPRDYTSVFCMNLAAGAAMYLLLCSLSGPIADLCGYPELVRVIPLLFLTLPVSSLWLIHQTIFIKRMDFRIVAKVSLIAAVVSGVVSVWMAFTGWGVWALAWQAVIMNAAKTLLYWCWSRWRPTGGFSMASVRELFGYSSRIFVAELINRIFFYGYQLLVNRWYGATQFGFFAQAYKIKELPSATLTNSIVSVTFPALSKLQDDKEKLREGSRKVIMVMAFVLFPVMIGLSAVAPEFFMLVLTEKWMPAVPYFRIFCLAALTSPLAYVLQNVIKVKGRGQLILNLEIAKKSFGVVVIALTLMVSVLAVVWGQLIYMTMDMAINMYFARRLIGYRVRDQLRDVAPVFLLTLAMWAGTQLAGWLAAPVMGLGSLLLLKIAVGAGIYIGGARLFHLEAWNDTYGIVIGMLGRRQN